MTTIKNVCVYCGSSGRVDEVYKQAAYDAGAMVAKQGWGMVYGGGAVGLMNIVADAALENGGKAIGYIPEFLLAKEFRHEGLTELHVVDSMHERKQKMVEGADEFLILPGGVGTMDEFFEIVTWKQLGLHTKPIIVVNINGYWTHLRSLMETIITEKFARDSDRALYAFTDTIESIPAILAAATDVTAEGVRSKWI
jgi:uncharacterized protein (TIGR00730 family)